MKLTETILFNQIKKKSKVIDLGCGGGVLLNELIHKKSCDGYGIEQNFQEVLVAMGRGIPVYQGDILVGLKQFDDGTFDIAILSQTLQQVMNPIDVIHEMCRVSKKAIVTFPNFGHWKVRFHLLTKGYSPKTKQLPHEWHNTPNIRVITIKDFRKLCAENNINILKEIPLAKFKFQRLMFPLRFTNFWTEKGIFIIEKKQ